ncbi:MAG: hypothetical protein ABW116_06830, partial [Candidatus Sedimenticola sp. 20ELBAFRAG]
TASRKWIPACAGMTGEDARAQKQRVLHRPSKEVGYAVANPPCNDNDNDSSFRRMPESRTSINITQQPLANGSRPAPG